MNQSLRVFPRYLQSLPLGIRPSIVSFGELFLSTWSTSASVEGIGRLETADVA